MVDQNNRIKGININNLEIKQSLFADDITFFMKDVESLQELKSGISLFSKYSSLTDNYEKSEAAWIGSQKNSTIFPEGYLWLHLCKKSIKILGICLTYNKVVHQNDNYQSSVSA